MKTLSNGMQATLGILMLFAWVILGIGIYRALEYLVDNSTTTETLFIGLGLLALCFGIEKVLKCCKNGNKI